MRLVQTYIDCVTFVLALSCLMPVAEVSNFVYYVRNDQRREHTCV